MVITRLGKNYEFEISSVNYLINPIDNEKMETLRILKENKKLVLYLSDNLTFNELTSLILESFGFFEITQIPWVTFNDNNIACRDWIDKEKTTINIDSPLYPYLNPRTKVANEFIISSIQRDFSIVSFKVVIKQITDPALVATTKPVSIQKYRSRQKAALKNFETNWVRIMDYDIALSVQELGLKLAKKFDKALFEVMTTKRKPIDIDTNQMDIDALCSFILNRVDLRTIPLETNLFENRKHIEQLQTVWYRIYDSKINLGLVPDDENVDYDPHEDYVYTRDEMEEKKSASKEVADMDKNEETFNAESIIKNNPDLEKLFSGDYEEFNNAYKNQFKNIEQLQKRFVDELLKASKGQKLTIDQMKNLMKVYLESGFEDESKQFGISPEDTEQVLSSVYSILEKELEAAFDDKNDDEKSDKDNNEDSGEIN
ncbi:hypothetical protein OF364_02780 [Mycoplasma enhydrae]|uniref:hypothetical protein n=1 Tax=Mycoplasma enhydrae TaxID=2499220 RepID=UPI00197B72C5|nr:hypothetical protein [Mycoplasma enhydrae]MBN4089710.1 hypothetical protein [Mycoplasma enhydrae]MCV3753727.1 hypothetical protein [Mycoplasma enhydrae]